MKLSLGPVLFYWDKEQLGRFYADMAALPLDVIYLGETVCAKRRALNLDQWLGLGRELQACSPAQIVLSSLTLIEAASELSSLRRLCDNGELLVEANDMGAVQLLIERKVPFVGGPALNLYNGHALVQLLDAGMQRWVPPVECSHGLIADVLEQVRELGRPLPEVEIFAYGHLPLAYSARCFSARAENRPKDDCQFCCINYPDGMALTSQEGQALFTLNGIQTMSAEVTNLLADYPGLVACGADLLRLSPRAEGMAEVVRAFDEVRQGATPPLVVSGCNGYWHGQAGMLRVEEVGLC
ncbi:MULTISPECIES: U32 family peptidase [Pseudomonas]|jgi:collagenase-like PrtC family protease|uniref:U32 family peptidase n=1 Tax=Pseudomonas TaxID=286 RepID=UPI0008B3C9BE|nr:MULTISPECIES: U32 family peptidase [Pseudomonas]UUN86416.1 U32 family peptidase [Pseudomonas extremorientalis]SET72767.1 Collagenase-like protease, PrtC family [Pseudomonas sp. NFR09]SFB42793.1 Collagenase-like protease, PrtC family [Pseudomonas sp. NFPP24]SFI26390.1 Collagenase-like protease, PrtC family [Pseudomonas sp. NFPP04]SFI90908.1 Collagenase-like protease, PrtC family [Pseudomonas sp. NFPP11]